MRLLTERQEAMAERYRDNEGASAGESPVVLIVDDDAANRHVLARMLKRLGYESACAVDGRDAVDQLQAGVHCDLVLMDAQMPRLNGYEATRLIRELRDMPASGIPILALTAAPSPSERKHAFAAGMDDFLEKPISLKTLQNKLALWLDQPPTEQVVLPELGKETGPAIAVLHLERLQGVPGFDPSVLMGLSRFDHNERGERVDVAVVRLVLQHLPSHTVSVMEACQSGNADALKATIHRLGGSARNVGAVRLSELCAHTEQRLDFGNLEVTSDLVPAPVREILAEASRMGQMLRALTKEGL